MKENVLRGIELLDRQVPGWRDRIDWDRLEMDSCYDCILGQLFDFYCTGLDELGLIAGIPDGFDADFTTCDYGELTELWRQAARPYGHAKGEATGGEGA